MLTVDNLSVFYGDAQALDDVSLAVEAGTIVAIVGANGAGKTSLIRTIGGMIKPATGRIRFHDQEIASWPSHLVCNLGIGQVAAPTIVASRISGSLFMIDMGARIAADTLECNFTGN